MESLDKKAKACETCKKPFGMYRSSSFSPYLLVLELGLDMHVKDVIGSFVLIVPKEE